MIAKTLTDHFPLVGVVFALSVAFMTRTTMLCYDDRRFVLLNLSTDSEQVTGLSSTCLCRRTYVIKLKNIDLSVHMYEDVFLYPPHGSYVCRNLFVFLQYTMLRCTRS